MKLSLPILICLLFTSCATIHPGKMGKAMESEQSKQNPLCSISKNVKLSIEKVKDFSSNNQAFYKFSFENVTSEWQRIKKIEVDFEDENDSESSVKPSVIVGNDLMDWAKAIGSQLEMKNNNDNFVPISFLTLGTSLLLGSKDKSSAAIGAMATGAGVVGLLGINSTTKLSKGDGENWVPSDHVYNKFSIPGKMFVRKWMVLYSPSGYFPEKMIVTIETFNEEVQKFVVDGLPR